MRKYEEEKSMKKDMVQSVVNGMGFNDYNVSDNDVKLYNEYKRGIITYDEFHKEISKKDDLLKQYKKGLIDDNELEKMYDILSTPANYINNLKSKHGEEKLDLDTCTSEELDKILLLKLESEYNDMKNNLLDKSAEEIIDSAYEITSKREIIDGLINNELYDEEKKIMINQKGILNEFYHDWLDTDIPLGDSMTETIEESISTLTRYYNKNNEKENNDDRNK